MSCGLQFRLLFIYFVYFSCLCARVRLLLCFFLCHRHIFNVKSKRILKRQLSFTIICFNQNQISQLHWFFFFDSFFRSDFICREKNRQTFKLSLITYTYTHVYAHLTERPNHIFVPLVFLSLHLGFKVLTRLTCNISRINSVAVLQQRNPN